MTSTHEKVSHLPASERPEYTATSAARGIEEALKFIEGRWKLLILFHLFGGRVLRFSDLERAIPAISQKMLRGGPKIRDSFRGPDKWNSAGHAAAASGNGLKYTASGV
jgi:hypothetical protein